MEMSKKNHGTVTSTVGRMKFKEAYGKDDSDVTGSASDERGGSRGGSTTNLSHSLSGASANQKGS